MHHTVFLQQLINQGQLKLKGGGSFKGQRITYHDSCYLGRANNIYEAPRELLSLLDAELVEMRRCGSRGLCCGAGGAQMFKEEEKGTRRVNQERTDDILAAQPTIVASGCPFCMTMLTDGIKEREQQQTEIKVMDFAELIAQVNDLI
ncbi:MAG TPA: (Fe-S)-binding protein [Chitinophagales bacterium]|nr:(Fe-S)-binding protein [Chitinophagales bacterium]